MDKVNILNRFNGEEKIEVSNLYEKYIMSYNKDITMFGTNFYPPNIWGYFQKTLSTKDYTIESYGFFKDAERRMISFNNIYESDFPMKILKITPQWKLNSLSHKDFLGSILALGINRNKLGDLVLKEESCYVAVVDEMVQYILDNLSTIGKCTCKVMVLEGVVEPFGADFKEEIILTPSLRVDALVSKITKLSRGKSQDFLGAGKVLLNYSYIKDNSKEAVVGDRLSIRGYGKYVLGNIVGNSKSGKYKIIIKKYT